MNGCLGTLKAETARPPERDMAPQQERFDHWRLEFNEERPHEALGLRNPGVGLRVLAALDAGAATGARVPRSPVRRSASAGENAVPLMLTDNNSRVSTGGVAVEQFAVDCTPRMRHSAKV